MARLISQIQKQILDNKNADPTLSQITSPSMTAVFLCWSFITAVAINIFEQLLDVFKIDYESHLPAAALGSNAWIQNQVLKVFQYDATTPQVLTCDATTNFIPTYGAQTDSNKLLCTRCAIVTLPSPNKIVEVKVAKGEPPQALTGGSGGAEGSALSDFLTKILPAGTSFNLVADDADRLYIEAAVLFNGSYNATIFGAVKAALNTYLKNIDFNGKLKVSDIENTIRQVPGVNDVNIGVLSVRRWNGSIGQNMMYDLSTGTNNLTYQLYAGWAIEEDTPTFKWIDKIQFIAN